MNGMYESTEAVPARKLTPLEELQGAAVEVEHCQGSLARAREEYDKAVDRWNNACRAAGEWIESHSPDATRKERADRSDQSLMHVDGLR